MPRCVLEPKNMQIHDVISGKLKYSLVFLLDWKLHYLRIIFATFPCNSSGYSRNYTYTSFATTTDAVLEKLYKNAPRVKNNKFRFWIHISHDHITFPTLVRKSKTCVLLAKFVFLLVFDWSWDQRVEKYGDFLEPKPSKPTPYLLLP